MPDFPIITGKPAFYPNERACPICGRQFQDQIVYLYGGAKLPEGAKPEGFQGYLQVGVHTSAVDCAGSKHLDVVSNSYGGHFDLTFCSSACLSEFFMSIVRKLDELS